ncbi:putative anterior gradient protein 3 like protein [Cricetulus griseus]|uniref:Putative anterior gradient protein 3 like protein n=1 Tax=Cricetulus griseus TaxID=10029 RepID=A0A061I3V2_CRIGR|nr:putative anterior gradient protein 3 like protein [Cricetulus griseus]
MFPDRICRSIHSVFQLPLSDFLEDTMLHSTLALCLLMITVSSNLAIAIKKEKRPPQTLSRGWGDDITWVQTYEEGLFHARKSQTFKCKLYE